MCLFFQFYQFIIQCIIFQIAHDFPCPQHNMRRDSFFQYSRQFFHPSDRLLSFLRSYATSSFSLFFISFFHGQRTGIRQQGISSFRSSPSMFLQVPSFKLPSRIFMILTLCRVITRYPSVSHIRRICRFLIPVSK